MNNFFIFVQTRSGPNYHSKKEIDSIFETLEGYEQKREHFPFFNTKNLFILSYNCSNKFTMKIQKEMVHQNQSQLSVISFKSCENEEEKLKEIRSFVKDLKNYKNSKTLSNFSWPDVKNQANFLLEYLSRNEITNRTLFFNTLATFDSLLNIFKMKLFSELKINKTFYRNIQSQFQHLCFQFEGFKSEKTQKQLEFQLQSVLYLLTILIYFSGKRKLSQKNSLPLHIINKTFLTSFLSLDINITQKNERIVGLIISYVTKRINIKLYGQKMLCFILSHFDKISTSKTLYNFVYCLREIHLSREIDITVIQKFSLFDKLINFWMDQFYNRQSTNLVDYINIILKKYPSLIFRLRQLTSLEKLLDFQQINNLGSIHQGLILEIKAKLLPNIGEIQKQLFYKKAFDTCQTIDYSLKYLSCFIVYQKFDTILHIFFPFVHSLKRVVKNGQIKSIVFAFTIFNQLLSICIEQRSFSLLEMIKNLILPTIQDLITLSVCKEVIAKIKNNFSKSMSIQYQPLC